MSLPEVAVTGVGAICAAGGSVPQVMDSLYAGEVNAAAPTGFHVELDSVFPVFEVTSPLDAASQVTLDFEPTRTTQLALIATEEALRGARLRHETLQHHRVGVCLGTTVGCTLNDETFYREFRDQRFPGMNSIHRYLANNPAQCLADVLGLSGPVVTIANACSSGTDAVGLAKTWIETDRCDIAIAGGADELSRIPYLGFIRLLLASQQPPRPFDKNRDGLNLGEGAGIVVLESAEHARRREVPELAHIAGYASFADAYHPTAPHPDGIGLKRAIQAALVDARVAPKDVGFINAHATATMDNDRVEGRVLRDTFPPDTPVVATKSYTGHTLGAAGGLEAVLTIQALVDQRLLKTAGFRELDPEIEIRPTEADAAIDCDTAISNSLAFGGNNSVLVFRRRRR
ncbi:MAG: beta-ketoacyl-[acyl-carrier-protein] synthase family protein [Phycisphaerales bacterium]|nr:MAG: beta-ketoacyl-[acyl-carrier-protein] synthase family protein [Phycisphaerales bacterium]